jgi:hypothetical protein
VDAIEIEIDFLESEDYRPLFSVCDGSRLPAGVEIEPMFLLPRSEQAAALRFVIKPGEALRFAAAAGAAHEGIVRFLDGELQPAVRPPDTVGPRLAGSGSQCRLYWQRIDAVSETAGGGAVPWRFALFDLEVEPIPGLERDRDERLRRLIEQGKILVDPAIAHPPPLYDPPRPKPDTKPDSPPRGR